MFDTEGMVVLVPIDVDWQLPVIRKVKFDATIIGINDVVKVADANRWIGFIVFKCEAKENLGSRLMWANIDVTFANDATRSFRASFYINVKGCQYDIKKIDMESVYPLKIKKIVVKSVAIKWGKSPAIQLRRGAIKAVASLIMGDEIVE